MTTITTLLLITGLGQTYSQAFRGRWGYRSVWVGKIWLKVSKISGKLCFQNKYRSPFSLPLAEPEPEPFRCIKYFHLLFSFPSSNLRSAVVIDTVPRSSKLLLLWQAEPASAVSVSGYFWSMRNHRTMKLSVRLARASHFRRHWTALDFYNIVNTYSCLCSPGGGFSLQPSPLRSQSRSRSLNRPVGRGLADLSPGDSSMPESGSALRWLPGLNRLQL